MAEGFGKLPLASKPHHPLRFSTLSAKARTFPPGHGKGGAGSTSPACSLFPTRCPQSWSHWTPHCGSPSTAQGRPTTWPHTAKSLKATRMGVRVEASAMLGSLRWLHSDPRAWRAWSPVVFKPPRELAPGTARGCELRPPSPFHLERLLLYLFYLWKVQSKTTFLDFAG